MISRISINFAAILAATATLIMLTACQPASDAEITSQPAPQIEPADLILKNAWVYTVDPARSVAEAVAIRDDTIIFVGSNAEVAALVGDQTEVRDLGGAMVMLGAYAGFVPYGPSTP